LAISADLRPQYVCRRGRLQRELTSWKLRPPGRSVLVANVLHHCAVAQDSNSEHFILFTRTHPGTTRNDVDMSTREALNLNVLFAQRIHHIPTKPRNPNPPQRPLNHPFPLAHPTTNNNNLINRANTHIPRRPPTPTKAFIRILPPRPS
jgi:hypothetical protein